jgi:catechol 2,3-dioxygenase-like lactoylglutathione lyase family enzyme
MSRPSDSASSNPTTSTRRSPGCCDSRTCAVGADGHPLELLAFPEELAPAGWHDTDGADPLHGIDPTAIAVSDPEVNTRFFKSMFGFGTGARTEDRGPEQAALDDIDDVHVSVTRLAPDLPASRLELVHYHVGTRRPIRHDTAGNDIAATHSVVRVASLDATAMALARCGAPLSGNDIVVLRDGRRVALVLGPDGHRFLLEEVRH